VPEAEREALDAHLLVCPACSAVHEHYLQTAALLRRTPDPDPLPGLPPALLQEWAREREQASVRHLKHLRPVQELPMQTLDTESTPAPSLPPPRRPRASHRVITVMSAVAAVLIIALMATALVASHTTGTSSSTASGPTATAGRPATSTPTRPSGQWEALLHLANISLLTETWLAPSNPQVVYQMSVSEDRSQVTLRRSDDEGANWNNLPSPTGNALPNTTTLYISPTNARHVLAIVNSDCSTGQAMTTDTISPLSNGKMCSAVYFSSNGGARWTTVTLPAHGSHNLFSDGFTAQGNRIYGLLLVDPGYTASELVMSSDDGATWSFADNGLTPDQNCIQHVLAPRTGTTLFAMTMSHCIGSFSGSDTVQIWRSDDSGAHWTQVSSVPATAFGLEAVNVSGQAQPVLYYPDIYGGLQISLDGGKTWQQAPALPVQPTGGNGVVGVLSDGSFLEEMNNGLYTWKIGDTGWQKIASTPGMVSDAFLTFDANGHATLYAEVESQDKTALTFYRLALS
jgi:hypothetical protein